MKSNKSKAADLHDRIQAALDGGLSQARLAKEAGVSSSALNQWLKRTYRGDEQAVAAKLEAWLRECDARDAAPLPEAPAFVETPTAKKLISGLEFAQRYQDLVVLYGGAGIGKTTSIREYASRAPNVWIVTACPTTSTKAAALHELAEAVGLRGLTNRPNEIRREIARHVSRTRGLIVVDEAQHLAFDSLECLRRIYDDTGIGLALVGNELVYSKLSGGARKAAFAQLFSRVGRRVHVLMPLDEDVSAIANAWKLTGKRELALARDIAAAPGALRGLVKTLRLASFAALGDGGVITYELMQTAWASLGGD